MRHHATFTEWLIERLVNFAARMGRWGYPVFFIMILLECQVLLGFFMPGERLVIAAGFLASQGLLDWDVLIYVIAVAAIAGDTIGHPPTPQ